MIVTPSPLIFLALGMLLGCAITNCTRPCCKARKEDEERRARWMAGKEPEAKPSDVLKAMVIDEAAKCDGGKHIFLKNVPGEVCRCGHAIVNMEGGVKVVRPLSQYRPMDRWR